MPDLDPHELAAWLSVVLIALQIALTAVALVKSIRE